MKQRMEQIDVFLVDDNPTLLASVKYAVNLDKNYTYCVSFAYDGAQAMMRLKNMQPDIIVLDEVMPRLRGSDLAQFLRANGNNVPIIMLSARTRDEDQVRGLESGCDIYLTKPFKPSILLAAIHTLLRQARDRHVNGKQPPLRFGDLEMNTEEHSVRLYGNHTLELTPREFALLELFLSHPRQVLSRSLILEHVWGNEYEGESNVIDVYVGCLRKKLKAAGLSRLIHTVRGFGYVLRNESEK